MKNIVFVTLIVLLPFALKAQKINPDTLAKYSKKEEQLKVFKVIATDIQLNKNQTTQFNMVSLTYADRAIKILKDTNLSQMEVMQSIITVGQEYAGQLKIFITPKQMELMKAEQEKYHFGRRFISMN